MILNDKYPYENKWFRFVNWVAETRDENALRKLARIAEFMEGKSVEGDPLLIETLIECVEQKAILDIDGFGEYISFENFSSEKIKSVEDIADLEAHKNDCFAVWYNK